MVVGQPFRVTVISPVFRDWESASLVCRALDGCCDAIPGAAALEIRVLFVDDGSPDGLVGWEPFTPRKLQSIEVLWLRRNLGHQRAIVTALCDVEARGDCDAVLVMDADGEDKPEDAARLIELAMKGPPRIIFAERRKRLESPTFRVGYHAYRILHHVLTGIPVRVGNFSILPFAVVRRLTCMSEAWNHFVGAIFKSKLPFDCIPTARGERLRGRSRMDLVALVNHGLAGIATFQDVAATRILLAAVAATGMLLAALATVVGIRLGTTLAVPGWATYSAGLLLVLFSQIVAVSFSLVFMLMSGRGAMPFIPTRDCALFMDRRETLWSRT